MLKLFRCLDDICSGHHSERSGRKYRCPERFILHQDNDSSQTAAATQLEISVLGMKQMSHPPYSPDLAPFDFAIFPHIKLQLQGVRFETLKNLQTAVNSIIKSTTNEWYNDIISGLIATKDVCSTQGHILKSFECNKKLE